MATLQKPRFVTYEDAGPDLRAKMEKLFEDIESRPSSREAIVAFGAPQIRQYKKAVEDLESFFAEPASPEMPQEKKDSLRKQYLDAAEAVSLMLGAGYEVLRRYEAEYLPEASHDAAMTCSFTDRQHLDGCILRKRELANRLVEIELPENANEFVKTAILRIEAHEMLQRGLKNGMQLEQSVTVKRTPLKLVAPGRGNG